MEYKLISRKQAITQLNDITHPMDQTLFDAMDSAGLISKGFKAYRSRSITDNLGRVCGLRSPGLVIKRGTDKKTVCKAADWPQEYKALTDRFIAEWNSISEEETKTVQYA
ncbi:hypothetical protein H8D04_00035 [bacterium]|nr:hypothetical protein [bacterium]